jgi:phospholipid transport system substrate-binding protein
MRKYATGKATKMILQARLAVVSLLFLLSYLLLPSPSRADGPMEQVRATVEKVLTILRNPNLKSQAQQKNLRAQLGQAIYPRFDFAEMAKRSLGPHWGPRSLEEQQEFVKIFAAMLEKSYVDRIESYSSQNILYTREVEDANYAVVDTKIVTDNREKLSINYKLHSVNKEWKVYDLVIEDISVVNNYRSQFNRVIVRSSFEDLVRMMKDKQSQHFEKSR